MIVLDTTVLVYAKGAEHALRHPCRRLVAAIADGSVQATTTVEVLQEFAHVRARRRDRADAVALTRSWLELLSPLLPIDREHLLRGLGLFESHARLGAFDAILAAATLDAGGAALVSADRAFAGIHALHHVFPDDAGVARLLN